MTELTCLSCDHHRPAGCTQLIATWPEAKLAWCRMGRYMPGSDEAEDSHETAQGARTGDDSPLGDWRDADLADGSTGTVRVSSDIPAESA